MTVGFDCILWYQSSHVYLTETNLATKVDDLGDALKTSIHGVIQISELVISIIQIVDINNSV